MSNYNDYMNNEYSRHKYQSYEEKTSSNKNIIEDDDTIGIFKDDTKKLNKPLICKDTSELTKAFFNKRNEEQQEQRDIDQQINSNLSPRQFKNNR